VKYVSALAAVLFLPITFSSHGQNSPQIAAWIWGYFDGRCAGGDHRSCAAMRLCEQGRGDICAELLKAYRAEHLGQRYTIDLKASPEELADAGYGRDLRPLPRSDSPFQKPRSSAGAKPPAAPGSR
jgi:hypothetical protein